MKNIPYVSHDIFITGDGEMQKEREGSTQHSCSSKTLLDRIYILV